MVETNSKEKLLEAIKKADKILVTSHINPDIDAVCSCISVYWILKSLQKKNVDISLEEDVLPLSKEFLDGIDKIQNVQLSKIIENYDMVFFLDSNTSKRFSRFPFEVNSNTKIVHIDHHASGADLAVNFDFTDSSCSSTCEMIYRVFNDVIDFSPMVAKAVLAGIFNDSQAFTTKEVTKKTFEIIADLIGKGAKLAEISAELKEYDEVVLNTLKVLINNLGFD